MIVLIASWLITDSMQVFRMTGQMSSAVSLTRAIAFVNLPRMVFLHNLNAIPLPSAFLL